MPFLYFFWVFFFCKFRFYGSNTRKLFSDANHRIAQDQSHPIFHCEKTYFPRKVPFPENSTALTLLKNAKKICLFVQYCFFQPNHLKANGPSISEHFYFLSIHFLVISVLYPAARQEGCVTRIGKRSYYSFFSEYIGNKFRTPSRFVVRPLMRS